MEEKLYSIDDIIKERIIIFTTNEPAEVKDSLLRFLDTNYEFSIGNIVTISDKLKAAPQEIVGIYDFEIVEKDNSVEIYPDYLQEIEQTKYSYEDAWVAFFYECRFKKAQLKKVRD